MNNYSTFDEINNNTMPQSLVLTDAEAAILVEVHTKELNDARAIKKDADIREQAAIERLIALGVDAATLHPSTILLNAFKKQITSTYNTGATIIGKITFVLNESGKEMTTQEINQRLLALDETYQKNSLKSGKMVASVLSVNHGEGKPFKRIKDDKGFFRFSMNK